jgi:hypothetical protein
MPKTKAALYQPLKTKAPVQGPGHICRAGNNCRAKRS